MSLYSHNPKRILILLSFLCFLPYIQLKKNKRLNPVLANAEIDQFWEIDFKGMKEK